MMFLFFAVLIIWMFCVKPKDVFGSALYVLGFVVICFCILKSGGFL